MHHHETARTSSRGAPKDTETTSFSEPTWMAFTIIEDDDLMFGGKPLSTWYEEDRRCSMGEDSHGQHNSNAPSPGSTTGSSTDEDEERGRRRDRVQYTSKPHKKH
ncbi:hypothetical protein SEUCBS139899_005610 [Sporothrix eucalyptigena]|uniref:Uncharacterized protein n=1 Tax=Sporothrix eucalyptigena TaxID=1812306 RepID=A0ABP0C236_9PEZI